MPTAVKVEREEIAMVPQAATGEQAVMEEMEELDQVVVTADKAVLAAIAGQEDKVETLKVVLEAQEGAAETVPQFAFWDTKANPKY